MSVATWLIGIYMRDFCLRMFMVTWLTSSCRLSSSTIVAIASALPRKLSSKLRHPQSISETLEQLLVFYGERLRANGADFYDKYRYGYATFSNGSLISTLARRLYSVTMDQWGEEDPFDGNGRFFKSAKRANLLSNQDQSGKYSSGNLPANDWRIKTINRLLFSLPRFIGGDNIRC